jgi:hypothetical protein
MGWQGKFNIGDPAARAAFADSAVLIGFGTERSRRQAIGASPWR